jgi:chromosome segregation ATPase
LLQQLRDENEQLQQHLTTVRSHNITLGQQLIKEQSELKSAHVLTERLQQKIKQLQTVPLATTAAMRSSQVPVDGYPPQVLLSVAALVFIATLLFF